MSQELRDLLERVSRAEEADPRLDWDLALALGTLVAAPWEGKFMFSTKEHKGFMTAPQKHGYTFGHLTRRGNDATASTESALKLLAHALPGWTYTVDASAPDDSIDVDLFPPGKTPPNWERLVGVGCTLPLAICAAILKAKLL